MKILRVKKSENELNCLRAAYDICENTLDKVLNEIRPGMTESNVVGIVQKYIYEYGAEYEGMVQYVLSDRSSRHALSRAMPDRIIKRDSFVQLDIAARVDGYSSAIGIPISMGKYTPEQLRCVEFGREVHEWIKPQLREGILASDIAKNTIKLYKDRGFGDNYLYGPLHGLGMIEVEAPWVETTSDYKLEENYCYQIDTFLISDNFGLRWEEGVRITKDGYELFNKTPVCSKNYELGF
jgi:Xaa-Pro aminopeptidase